MEKASIIGTDLAKHVLQLHGARADGLGSISQKDSPEQAFIAPQGVVHIGRLAAEVGDTNDHLPSIVVELYTLLLAHNATVEQQIAALDQRIRQRA